MINKKSQGKRKHFRSNSHGVRPDKRETPRDAFGNDANYNVRAVSVEEKKINYNTDPREKKINGGREKSRLVICLDCRRIQDPSTKKWYKSDQKQYDVLLQEGGYGNLNDRKLIKSYCSICNPAHKVIKNDSS